MPREKREINLDEWYTNDQAVKRLSENSGRLIDRNYPRTLARYGKVETLDIGTGSKLYKKSDIDVYVVDTKRGRKPKKDVKTAA
jgi:hypothetical protein